MPGARPRSVISEGRTTIQVSRPAGANRKKHWAEMAELVGRYDRFRPPVTAAPRGTVVRRIFVRGARRREEEEEFVRALLAANIRPRSC